MYNGYRFIDSDAHILEPPDRWERYLEPPFRNEMPRSYVDYQGDPLGFGIQAVVGDYTMPFSTVDAAALRRGSGSPCRGTTNSWKAA